MKKIFLLSLLSVLLLSVYSQNSSSKPEVLAKISISKIADDLDEDPPIIAAPWWPSWWFLYKDVYTEIYPGGAIVNCIGQGWHWCRIHLKDLLSSVYVRGMAAEAVDGTYQDMLEESEELLAKGEFQGSITKKISYPDPDRNGKESYLLFQMKWENDFNNPYNGQTEIIITKTDNLGF